MNTADKLDRLYELEETANQRVAFLDAEKKKLINSILTPEIQAAIKEIEEEFSSKYEAIANDDLSITVNDEIKTLRKEIEDETILANKSLKGKHKQAVLTKEKKVEEIIVDTGILVGMTVNFPKLQACWKKEEIITPAKVVIRKIS